MEEQLFLSSLQCIAALVLTKEEQSTLTGDQEWQLTEELRNSCSSVIPHKPQLCSFSGLCGCAGGLGLGLLKTCLHSLCYLVVVWMVTSETFSLAGKLKELGLNNQTGTGGNLMFGIVNK